MHRLTKLFFMILFLLALSPLAVMANATIVVNTTADEDTPNLFCSLREAIIAANNNANYNGCTGSSYANDTITFSASVFNTSQTITLGYNLPDIMSQMKITGPGANLLTVDGDDLSRAFLVSNSATVTISGMTLLDASDPAGSGGGIYADNGTVTVNNMVFTSSIASQFGGAIYVGSGATVKVNNSSFQDNTATIGGAIFSEGTLRVSNSSFINNDATDFGGAITNTGANSVIGGSLFYSNSSNIHGGAYVGIGTVFNSTFNDNNAMSNGGAFYNPSAGTLKLIHVTVFGNAADNGGGGIYMDNGTLSLMNSIVADNGTDCIIAGLGSSNINYSLIEDGGCGITNGVNGNLAARALFDPNGLQSNGGVTQTLALSPASPGVNVGSNSYRSENTVQVDFNGDGDKADTLSTDQRGTGFPRTNFTTVDMGAFETNTSFTGLTVDTTSDAILHSCTNAANDCSLRGAIYIANARAGTDTISFASSVFSSPQTITLVADLPIITTNIIINGPGLDTRISGDNQYPQFFIDNGATLTINGLVISDGYEGTGSGSAFYIVNGTLNLSNSSVENNHSNGDGGAIYVQSGNLNITNSSFSGNSSNISGGAIYSFSAGTMRITDSSFSDNSSQNSGGAIATAGSVIIGGSTFSGNTGSEGAGIRVNGGVISNSTFVNNNSPSQGGAINNDADQSLSLINVTISNNSASSGMGGAGVYTGNAALFVMNSIIANSTAGGECSTNSGIVTVYNSLIEDGSCGVVSGVNGNLTGDPFLDPDGLQNNGGLTQTIELAPSSPAVNLGSTLWLSETIVGLDFNGDGDFVDTLSTDQRGSGFNRVINTNLDMGAFESPGGWTGFVVDTTSDADLFYCTSAANDCSLRGAINLANARSGADAISFDTSFFSTAKVISLNGNLPGLTGIVNINGPGENLLTIDGNFSYRPFYIENSAIVSISNLSVIHAASGLEDGAAIYIDNGSLNLNNTTFSNNEAATGQGGVIYANLGSLNITGSSFSQNLASGNGGVIATNDTHLDIDNSYFDQNSSNNNGGAIAISTGGTINIRNSFFGLNDAATNGGAIYTTVAIHVLNSEFSENSASGGGGAIIAVTDFATIVDSSFSENSAGSGGAVYGWIKAVNSSFAYNTAISQGGAIFTYDEDIYLFNTSIGFNSAGTGGGLYTEDGYIQLLNTIVADSTSGGDCVIGGTGSFLGIAAMIEDGGCGIVDGVNGNLVDDPMFDVRGLQDNGGSILTLTLSPQSPAINAGDVGPSNGFLTETGINVDINADGDFDDSLDYDQRGTGFARLAGGLDMGAVEQTNSISLVVDTTSDTNLVICTSAPWDCSLRGAINLANMMAGANAITFNTTVFATAQTITLTSDLPSISDDLTITGPGVNLLTIDGQDSYRPFYIENSATVAISALEIEDAASTDFGGTFNVDTGSLTLDNVAVNSSSSVAGGAVLFSNNGTNVVINTSSFSSNSTPDNGGVIYNQGNLYISNSSFSSNHADNNGGAIYSETATTVIGGSSFLLNTATFGGAIYGSADVFNSSFYLNNASSGGGAFYVGESLHVLTLVNVTASGNTSVTGGGIQLDIGTINLMNTIVANNAGDCSFIAGTINVDYSLIEDGGCGITNGVDGNLVAEPIVDPLGFANNGGLTQTIALSTISQARDAGYNDYLSEAVTGIDYNDDNDTDDTIDTDQRGTGFNRVIDGTVDMGAYETSGTFNGLVVDTNLDGTNFFCTSAPNDCSLSGAILNANGIAGDDTITFDGTVFASAQTIILDTNSEAITGDLTITGPGINLLTIEKEDASQVFTINNGIVLISGMSLVGDDSNPGSLIYLAQGNLSVNNMSFSDNVAYSGGAIYAQYGTTLTVSNSSFTENYAVSGDGGAINGATASSMTVTNSSFSNNTSANNGGAIFSDSTVYIANSSFSGNSALNGGAVYANANANITIGWSSFAGNNVSGSGGALYGDIDIFNSSIYANTANLYAGAFYPTDTPTLLNVTISANVAPTIGGIFINIGGLNIYNSVIANSTGLDCSLDDEPISTNYSLIEDGSCDISNGVNGNLTGAPYLGPFGNFGGTTNVISWLPYSPVINAGNNAYLSEAAVNIDFNNDGDTLDTLDTDQRGVGFNRVINTTVDMGAFEATPSTSVANVAPIRNYYSTNTPTLTWSRVSWATGYELQISSNTSFTALQCGTASVAAEELSYTTCTLSSGTYYWRVRAVSETGPGAWSTVDVFVIGGP